MGLISTDSHQIAPLHQDLIPCQLEVCYLMKLLIVFIAMGVIGVIGTVEYAQAENEVKITHHKSDDPYHKYDYYNLEKQNGYMKLDLEVRCDTANFVIRGEIIDHSQTYLDIQTLVNEIPVSTFGTPVLEYGYKSILQSRERPIYYEHINQPITVKIFNGTDVEHAGHFDTANSLDITFNKWELCNLDKKFMIKSETNYLENEQNEYETKLDKQKNKMNKWKERYNTCFDKKETIKTELSDLRSSFNVTQFDYETTKQELVNLETRFNILQSNNTESLNQLAIYKQNLTNANFEIEKLKQEKADLIKKVETLETQLQEN